MGARWGIHQSHIQGYFSVISAWVLTHGPSRWSPFLGLPELRQIQESYFHLPQAPQISSHSLTSKYWTFRNWILLQLFKSSYLFHCPHTMHFLNLLSLSFHSDLTLFSSQTGPHRQGLFLLSVIFH